MKNSIIISLICSFVLCGCSNTNTHYIGEQYLDAKYVNNPLGEEQAPDFDPLIRYDAFDCVTFVETALANGDINKLNKIRYKNGEIDFVKRNHFIESDWLTNNNSIVKNVSKTYGKTKTRIITIDKKNWFKKNFNLDTNFKKEQIKLEYIPYEFLSKTNIQKPLIVLFISDGNGFYKKIGTDLGITHMGFLLPGNILRHASRNLGCVTDTDFIEYVSKKKKDTHNIGIALVEIK